MLDVFNKVDGQHCHKYELFQTLAEFPSQDKHDK